MSSTIGVENLIQALAQGRATFLGQTGSGSTTTTIQLAGLNLGSANLAGNLVLLDAGALGTGSPPTVTTITSNTATSLTVPALLAAPSAGYNVWIFTVATIQANVSENVAQWGGTAVAAPLDDNTDGVAAAPGGIPRMLARLTAWTGATWTRLRLAASGALSVRDDATGATGAAVPGAALQVAGSDGANLRVLYTPQDDFGNYRAAVTEFRLEVFPATVPAGAVRHVGSGDDVAYQDLTINGTYRVDGVLRCGNLTIGAGGVLITGPGGEVETAVFVG